MAIVKDLIVGKDGNVRVARLTTADGALVRPLQRLYCLELGDKKELDESVKNFYEITESNCNKTSNKPVKVSCKTERAKEASNCNKTYL